MVYVCGKFQNKEKPFKHQRRRRLQSAMEIDHEMFSLPSADSRRTVVSFWQKNVQKYWLTTYRTMPALEKL